MNGENSLSENTTETVVLLPCRTDSLQDDTVHSRSSLRDDFTRDDNGRLKNIRARDESWMTQPLRVFTDKLQSETIKDKTISKKVRKFYKEQNRLIEEFQEVEERTFGEQAQEEAWQRRAHSLMIGKRLANATLVCNVLLLVAKAVAVGFSNSLSVISSLVDSCVDIATGIIIWWASKLVVKRNPYLYPQGRTRIEPIAIIVLSALMGSAALQIIREAVQTIISMATDKAKAPNIQLSTFILVTITVVVKLVLLVLCLVYGRRHKKTTRTMLVLAQDHRNDVMTNSLTLICLVITKFYPPAKYSDPVGAIIIGGIILVGWWQTGREHIRWLSGITAEPRFIQKLTFICLNHDKQIKGIDTVRAFYHGNNIFVEVDIVLPGSMRLREAHDIGESLQVRLESLDEVERAFVHLDYESQHDPRSEHKQV